MKKPIIGITTSRMDNSFGNPMLYVNETYPQAIIRSGGCPILIPLGATEADLLQILELVDGLLFTGGGDVHPDRYGSQDHPLLDGVDEDRDRVEIDLIQMAINNETPFLGICRGLQVINVAMGGSLFEDVLDQRPDSIQHDYYPDHARFYLAHDINVEKSSLLSSLLRTEAVKVNSLHHQSIRELAKGLKASAFAPDGVIEAVELPQHPFGLAVQWHPECLPDDANMDSIFQAFVNAANQ